MTFEAHSECRRTDVDNLPPEAEFFGLLESVRELRVAPRVVIVPLLCI